MLWQKNSSGANQIHSVIMERSLEHSAGNNTSTNNEITERNVNFIIKQYGDGSLIKKSTGNSNVNINEAENSMTIRNSNLIKT